MKKVLITCILAFSCSQLLAQTQTVGLFTHSLGSIDSGYILFAPYYASDTTYLIDKCGKLIHTWPSQYTPGADAYLLPDGSVLRAGYIPNPVFGMNGVGGALERTDWDGNVIWHYKISDSQQVQSHDICYLPNGNILVDVWENISRTDAIAAGRKTTLLGSRLFSPKVIELRPIGTDSAEVVWSWRLWDHLIQDNSSTKPNYGVVADHPELVNLNYVNTSLEPAMGVDWTHLNAVTYNPDLDQVMLSSHNFNEIWIIDHSTTTAEAASHTGGMHNKGGDLLYRWGNSAAYGRATSLGNKLYEQHDPSWITSGTFKNNIIVFNNGLGRPGGYYSSVDIIQPPVDSAGNYAITPGASYGPTYYSWSYQSSPTSDFYSMYMGSAQGIANDNVLICNAISGEFFEVDISKREVWNYVNPIDNGNRALQGTKPSNNAVYKCIFYPHSYPAFKGRALEPGAPLEGNPRAYTCNLFVSTPEIRKPVNEPRLSPNPTTDVFEIQYAENYSYILMDVTGKILLQGRITTAKQSIDMRAFNAGIYLVRLMNNEGNMQVLKLVRQ